MKQKRLKTRRIKKGYFWWFLKNTLHSDLKRFKFWLPDTIKFLTGRLLFIMVNYNSIREMNMDLVGKQCIDLTVRYNRIYKKNAIFMLCTPPQ